MNPPVIITSTFYRKMDLRFQLACQTVEKATAAGHTVVIVDGSPTEIIREELRKRGAHVFLQRHEGMGASRREAFFHAGEVAGNLGIKTFLWTEPEKHSIVPFIPEIVEPLECRNPRIVIPKRSKNGMETWPTFQQESEREANDAYATATGLHGFDPMFGPVAWSRKWHWAFTLCNPKLNAWEVPDTYVQHYAPLWALHNSRIRPVSVEIDMEYPEEQRKEEEAVENTAIRAKRTEQLRTLKEAYYFLGTRLSLREILNAK